MIGRNIGSCPRDVLGIDTPDDPREQQAPVPAPSADLLDRALAGWERFLATAPAVSDE